MNLSADSTTKQKIYLKVKNSLGGTEYEYGKGICRMVSITEVSAWNY